MVMVRIHAPAAPRPGEPALDYYLSTTEVTNEQYERFKGKHREQRAPSSAGDTHPATMVSHNEARDFVTWLSAREGRPYQLPSEREWQWAAQAGARRLQHATSDGSIAHDLANYAGTGGRDRYEDAAPVGSFPPNPLGLFDMSGNVWEWCDDWYYEEAVPQRVWMRSELLPSLDIPFFWYGLRRKWRVLRGGSFRHAEPLQRVDVRNAYTPGRQSPSWGFRVAVRVSDRAD